MKRRLPLFGPAAGRREATPSRPLRLNFHEQPDTCLPVFRSLLEQDGKNSDYIRSFYSVELPSTREVRDVPAGDVSAKKRAVRRTQIYWAILHAAGYAADQQALRGLNLRAGTTRDFDPAFAAAHRRTVRGNDPPDVTTLPELTQEMRAFADHARDNPGSPLRTGSGNDLFDADDLALLKFLAPGVGRSGPTLLRPYRGYHDPSAGDFVAEVIELLEQGETAILDLGNAAGAVRRYFSDLLSREVFKHQETRFVENRLEGHFVQLYFEEAHNLFPRNEQDLTGVYARFAKEGAKFHLGMVYSTQSPSTVSRDLLDQTENFFVGHLSSPDEAGVLAKRQSAFAGVAGDIVRARTPGFMRMLTQSNRFVVPVQARRYEPGGGTAAGTAGGNA